MIIWDQNKSVKLKLERNIIFEQIAEMILEEEYIDILEHTKRKNQKIFIIEINNYIHAVPFIIDEEDNIVLKTAYPSRKLQKKYRGKK
ncbi:MAG: toxin [candidate division KSB1 bacterium]|nr:toxin [candidate division KSB1 bacterium]